MLRQSASQHVDLEGAPHELSYDAAYANPPPVARVAVSATPFSGTLTARW
jgi:hypothetical protein